MAHVGEPVVHLVSQEQTGGPRRFTRRRLIWGAVIVVLMGGIMARLILNSKRVPPLAVKTLEDGTLLELRAIQNGPPNSFKVRDPSPLLASQPKERVLRFVSAESPAPDTATVWLSLSHLDSGKVLDPTAVAYCVLVDRNGWSWLSQETRRSHFAGAIWTQQAGSSGGGGADVDKDGVTFRPWQPLPQREFFDIVQGFSFARLPLQPANVRAYDANSRLMAEFPVTIPAGPAAVSSSEPASLPVTQEFQGLSVTLEDLKLQLQPEFLPGVRRFTLVPGYSLKWLGGEANGWTSRPEVRLTDDLGNAHSSLRPVSPHSRQWNVELLFDRTVNSPFAPEQIWMSDPIPIPQPGQIIELNQEREINGVKIKLLKILGAGHHEFQWTIPGFGLPPGTNSGGSLRRRGGPPSGMNSSGTLRRSWGNIGSFTGRLTPGVETWEADLKIPFVLFSHAGSGEYEVSIGDPDHFVSESGGESEVEQMPDHIAVINGPDRRSIGPTDKIVAGESGVRVTFRVAKPMKFQFQVRPPEFKIDPAASADSPPQDAQLKRQEGE